MVDGRRLTLEELARASGMTARNVRSYQSKGLIPPPAREGRRSVYDDRHVERLEAIRRAREQGASLILIKAHLDRGGRLPAALLDGGPAGTTSDGGPPLDVVRPLVPADGAETARHVERLVAAGALRRQDGQVVAVGAVAAALTELDRQGVGVAQSLRVAARAVEAATSVVRAAGEDDAVLRQAGAPLARLVAATLAATTT